MQSQINEDPAIEALRGFAALMVVVTHYAHLLTPQPGAWAFASTGVNLFFVLSGFVFAPYLFGKPLHIGPHLVRRFFRMYPLYFCALLIYVGLKEPADIAWQHFGVHLVMGQTLQSQSIAFFYNPAFWSLPPEVEFYLLLPLLVLVTRWAGFWLVLAIALAMHMALVYSASPDEVGTSLRALATVHFPGLLIQFMLGALGHAMASRLKISTRTANTAAVGFLGVLVWIAALWVFSRYLVGGTQPIPVWVSGHMGLIAAMAYMLIVAAVAGSAKAASPLTLTACVWAGRLSYGIYLFHNGALQVVASYASSATGATAFAMALTLTVTAAWVAHKLIEAPCRNFGRRMGQALLK